MAYTVPFDEITKDIKERRNLVSDLKKKNTNEKCKQCGHNIQAIGKSTIPGVCSICISLALIPDPENKPKGL